jgi:hypothetical protein
LWAYFGLRTLLILAYGLKCQYFVGPVSSSTCILFFVEWKITERKRKDPYVYVFETISCYNVLSLLKLLAMFYFHLLWVVDCKSTHTFGYNKKQLEHSNQPVIAQNIRTS